MFGLEGSCFPFSHRRSDELCNGSEGRKSGFRDLALVGSSPLAFFAAFDDDGWAREVVTKVVTLL